MSETWTQEDVWYVVNDEDPPALNAGAVADGWFLARKTALTPMLRATGPLTVETQEGSYDLPDGWEGYIAVDRSTFPYPIAADEFAKTYEAVSPSASAES